MDIQQALDTLRSAIETDVRERILTSLGAQSSAPTDPKPSQKNGAGVRVPKPKAAPKTKLDGKRTPGELLEMQKSVLGFVKAHPGTNAEAIKKHLGVELNVISLPIQKLLAAKSVKRKGQRRATRYYPA